MRNADIIVLRNGIQASYVEELFDGSQRNGENAAMERKAALNVRDVSELLGISPSHAYEACQEFLRSGAGIPCFVLGRRIIIPREKFEAWLDEQVSRSEDAA